MGQRAGSAATNQTAFRDVNERIREGAERFLLEADELAVFLCECGDETCAEAVYATLSEYAEIRAEPGRFAVFPGHEGDERPIAGNERFRVVEALVHAPA